MKARSEPYSLELKNDQTTICLNGTSIKVKRYYNPSRRIYTPDVIYSEMAWTIKIVAHILQIIFLKKDTCFTIIR